MMHSDTLYNKLILWLIAPTLILSLAGCAVSDDDEGGLPPAERDTEAFVLVHGAWHDESSWREVQDALEQQGHQVLAPSMPGRGAGAVDAEEIELEDYAAAVIAAVEELHASSGETVTLVGHSAAGYVIQEAAPQVADELEQIVFVQPIILEDGQALFDLLPEENVEGLTQAAAANGGLMPVDEGYIRGGLIPGNTADEQDRVLSLLVAEPLALFADAVDSAEYMESNQVPVANIRFAEDQSGLPYDDMAQAAGSSFTVEIEGAGHEAMILMPQEFVEALLEAANQD